MSAGSGFAGIEAHRRRHLPVGERRHRQPADQSGRRNRRPREQSADHLQPRRRLRLRRRDRGRLHRWDRCAKHRYELRHRLHPVGYWASGSRPTKRRATASASLVDDPAARVRYNDAHDNCSDGIFVLQAGATLFKNRANNNGDIGIDAPPGTIDLGLNTATGNPIADCIGVICLPPSATADLRRLQVAVGERRPDARELQRGAPPCRGERVPRRRRTRPRRRRRPSTRRARGCSSGRHV